MAALGQLVVSLTAETAQFRQALDRATYQAERNFKSITNVAKAAAGAIAVGFGGVGIAATFSKMITEAEKAERALLRTQAVLDATGNAVGRTAIGLVEQAKQLNLATLQTEESILSAQQILLSYSNIVGANFDQTLELSADLASLMGTSLPGAVETFAKALDAPVERLTSLTRIGFNFTEQQKDQIKTLVESNRLFEAQQIILDVATKSFGGLARKEAEGYAGAQKALQEAIDDSLDAFAEQINLLENSTKFMRGLAEAVSSTTAFIIENRTALIAWALVFTGGALLAALPAITAGIVAMTGAVVALTAAFAANPIALGILAITAAAIPAIAALNDWSKSNQAASLSVAEHEREMKKLMRQQEVALGIFQQETEVIKDNKKEQEKIAEIIKKQQEAYRALFLTKEEMLVVDAKALNATQEQIGQIETLNNAIETQVKLQEQLKETQDEAISLAQEWKQLYESTRSPVQQLADEEARLLELRERLVSSGYDQVAVDNAIAEARLNIADAMSDLAKKTEETNKTALQFGDAFSSAFENAIISGNNLRGVLQGLLQDIIKIALRTAITEPLGKAIASAIPSFSFGSTQTPAPITDISVRGSGQALGGPVKGGNSYLVGEKGPEIFTAPAGGGQIIPNSAMGDNVVVNQTFNISAGVSQTVRAEISNLMPRIMEATKAAVVDSRRRGGTFSKAFS